MRDLKNLTIDNKTDSSFTGSYKGATIEISRDVEADDDFYILVWEADGCIAYDGWWNDSADKTIDEAVQEAIDGALLDQPDNVKRDMSP